LIQFAACHSKYVHVGLDDPILGQWNFPKSSYDHLNPKFVVILSKITVVGELSSVVKNVIVVISVVDSHSQKNATITHYLFHPFFISLSMAVAFKSHRVDPYSSPFLVARQIVRKSFLSFGHEPTLFAVEGLAQTHAVMATYFGSCSSPCSFVATSVYLIIKIKLDFPFS